MTDGKNKAEKEGSTTPAEPVNAGWREVVGGIVFIAVLVPGLFGFVKDGPTYAGASISTVTGKAEGAGRLATDTVVGAVELLVIVLVAAVVASIVRAMLHGRFPLSVKTPVAEASLPDIPVIWAAKKQDDAVEALTKWVAALDERLDLLDPSDDAEAGRDL